MRPGDACSSRPPFSDAEWREADVGALDHVPPDAEDGVIRDDYHRYLPIRLSGRMSDTGLFSLHRYRGPGLPGPSSSEIEKLCAGLGL